MRISDWSSDVCSSDLGRATADALAVAGDQGEPVDLGDAVGQRVLAQIQRLEAPVERRGLRVQAQAVALLPGVLALQVLRREESALPPEHLSQSVHRLPVRSEEHTSELQSLMRISYAVFCLKKKKNTTSHINQHHPLHKHINRRLH